MKKAGKVFAWICVIFMAAILINCFPSAASILALLFIAVCLPIPKWQEILQSIKIAGVVKAVALVVLFCAATVVFAFTYSNSRGDGDFSLASEATEAPATETPEITETPEVTEAPEATPAPTVEPTTAPTVEPTVEPTVAPTDAPTPTEEAPAITEAPITAEAPAETEAPAEAEAPVETLIHGHSSATIVYISSSGKIHSIPDCSGMKNYTEMTLGEADAKGYNNYCDNCW